MATRTYAKPTDTGAIATVGKDYLIYLNTGTSEATPTWTLLGGQRSGDSIEVRRSKFDTKLVRLSKRSFCEILQKKMLMGGTSNEE